MTKKTKRIEKKNRKKYQVKKTGNNKTGINIYLFYLKKRTQSQ